MRAETEYTVSRRDAHGLIVFDSASPVKTLEALVMKAREERDAAHDAFNVHAASLDREEKRLDELGDRLHRFEVALDAARKALGPDREEPADD